MGGNNTSKNAHLAAFNQAALSSHVLPDRQGAEMSGSHPVDSRLPAPAVRKFPGYVRSNIPNPFRRQPESTRRSSKERVSPKIQQTKPESKEAKVHNGEPKSAWKNVGRIEDTRAIESRSPNTTAPTTDSPKPQAVVDRNANRNQPLNYARQNAHDAVNGNQPDIVATVVANEQVARNGLGRPQQVRFGYQSQLQQPRKAEISRMPGPSKFSFLPPANVTPTVANGNAYNSNLGYGVPNATPTSIARPAFSRVPGIARASVKQELKPAKYTQEPKPAGRPEAKSTYVPSVEKKEEPPRRFDNSTPRPAMWGEAMGNSQPSMLKATPVFSMKPSVSDGRIGPKRDTPSGLPTRGIPKPSGVAEKSSSWDYHYRIRGPNFVPGAQPGSSSLSNLKPPAVPSEVESTDQVESQPTTWKYVPKQQLVNSKSVDVGETRSPIPNQQKGSPKDALGHGATRLEAVMDPTTKSFKLKPVSSFVGKNEVQQPMQPPMLPVRRQLEKNWSSPPQNQQLGGGNVSVSSCSVVTSSCDEESVDNDPKDELSLQFERNLENAFDGEQRKPVLHVEAIEVDTKREAISRLSDNQEEYEPKSSTSSGKDDSDSNSPRSSGHMGPSSGFLIDDEIGDQPDLLANSNDLTLSPCSNSGIGIGTDLFGYGLAPLHSSNAIRAVQESVEACDEVEEGAASRPDSLELRSVLDEEEMEHWSPIDGSTPEKQNSRMVSGQGTPSSGSLPTPGKIQCSSAPVMNRTIPFTGQSSTPSRIIFKPPKPMSAGDEDPSCARVPMSTMNHMSQDLTYLKTKLLGLRRILDQSETINPFDDSPQGSAYWYNLMHNMGASDGLSPCRTPTTPDASQVSPFNSGRSLPPPPCGDSGDMQALQEENLRLKRQLADLSRQSKFQKQQLEEKDKAIRHLNCQLAANAVIMYGRKKPEEESPPAKTNAATQTERPRNVSLERMGNIGPYISSNPPCVPGALGIPRMSGLRSPSRGRSRSQNRV